MLLAKVDGKLVAMCPLCGKKLANSQLLYRQHLFHAHTEKKAPLERGQPTA